MRNRIRWAWVLVAAALMVHVLGVPTAQAAPWPQPIENLSGGFFSPHDGWISADGRRVAMTNVYDRLVRVLDRSTGSLRVLPIPPMLAVWLTPDGSGVVYVSHVGPVGADPPGISEVYRYEMADGSITQLTHGTLAGLTFRVFGTNTDGSRVVLEIAPIDDVFPNVHSWIGVLDTATGVDPRRVSYLDRRVLSNALFPGELRRRSRHWFRPTRRRIERHRRR